MMEYQPDNDQPEDLMTRYMVRLFVYVGGFCAVAFVYSILSCA